MWDIPTVITTKADARKRVVIPQAKPGQVYAVQGEPDGIITLSPVKPIEPVSSKYKLVKKDGYTVIETDRQVSLETIKELLSEFP